MYVRTANRDAAEALKVVEEEWVWHSGVMEAIREKFPNTDMGEVSAELFGLLVNATER